MRTKLGSAEQRIGRIASRQYGTIAIDQMIAADISRSSIKRRVAKGLLIPEYRGVYRVGHAAPSVEARYMAAVLAGGERSALADRAAGHLMRLLKHAPPTPELVIPTERRIAGVETRQATRLDHRDTWTYRGIRCTTVARTLIDLAAVLDDDELACACHEAHVLYRTRPEAVELALERTPNAKGATTLPPSSAATPSSASASSRSASSSSSRNTASSCPRRTNESATATSTAAGRSAS